MKFYLLSDNIDTQMGFRLVGIDGVVLHEKQEVLDKLEEVIQDDSIAILLITSKLVQCAQEKIAQLKLTLQQPLIVEISDRHGSLQIKEIMDAYVSESIGMKL